MIKIAYRKRILLAGVAAVAGVVNFTGIPASAEPLSPQPQLPTPTTATIAQTYPLAAPAPATVVPAASGTLLEFLDDHGVTLEPQVSHGFTALHIVLPMPPRWSRVLDPNVPDAFAVTADRTSNDLYTPNAQLVVYKLVGDFDPRKAISHGFVDSQQLPGWQPTDASLADFNGFPSAFVEGSYRTINQMLDTSRRHVIATTGPDKYLVSLTVTATAGNQSASTDATATNSIVEGFRVGAPYLR